MALVYGVLIHDQINYQLPGIVINAILVMETKKRVLEVIYQLSNVLRDCVESTPIFCACVSFFLFKLKKCVNVILNFKLSN